MNIIELLTHFNLTRQESTIYMTLYTEGELTGYEVSKITGISRSNAYTALTSLVEKGASHIIEGTSTHYSPVPIQEFCDNKIAHLNSIKKELLGIIPKKREETEGYFTIKGEDNIINKMRNMLNDSKERVYISISGKIMEKLLPHLEAIIKKGLKVVIITNFPFNISGATVYHTKISEHQIRLIVDSSYVLTGDIIDGNNSTCLYSKKQNLIDLFKESLKNEIKLIELTK